MFDVTTGSTTLVASVKDGGLSVMGFSPQGDRILFSEEDRDGGPSLWSIPVEGSDARLIVDGTAEGEWLSL